MKDKKYQKLLASIVIDFIGVTSYFLFGLGEIMDIIWAPISAILNYLLYKNVWFSGMDFIEELLPFTDFIPTSTINWVYIYYVKDKKGV